MPRRPWNFNDHDVFVVKGSDVNILFGENVYADLTWIHDMTPEDIKEFRAVGDTNDPKTAVWKFLHTKENETSNRIGKSRISFPHTMRETACGPFGLNSVVFLIGFDIY